MDEDEAYALMFGHVVHRLRDEHGFSQRELALTVGITQGTLSRIEAGTLRADIIVSRRLSAALGKSDSELAALVQESYARMTEFAAKVAPPPRGQDWVGAVVALAGVAGIAALAALAVAAIGVASEEPQPAKQARRRR